MNTLTLNCNHCGGALRINANVRFCHCRSCGSSLSIHNDGNAAYTEVVGQTNTFQQKTLTPAPERADSGTLLLAEKEIERLDRQWAIDREQYRIKRRYSSDLPQKNTNVYTVIGIIGVVGFLFFWLSQVSTIPEKDGNIRSFFMLFGVLVLIIAVINALINVNKANAYQDAEKEYLRQRKLLKQKLEESTK